MLRTETLGYGVVIEGELTLVLDDSEVELKVGSVAKRQRRAGFADGSAARPGPVLK